MHHLVPRSAPEIERFERNASTYVCSTCGLGCSPPLVHRPDADRLLVYCQSCRREFTAAKLPRRRTVRRGTPGTVARAESTPSTSRYRCPLTRRSISVLRWQWRGRARYLECPHCHNLHTEREALGLLDAPAPERRASLLQRLAWWLGRLVERGPAKGAA